MNTVSVRLIRLSADREHALAEDPAFQEAMDQANWPDLARAMIRVVGETLTDEGEQSPEPHWGGYMAIDDRTREVVGSCAFKGPPTSDATVEIAYFTYPAFEGHGYATAMARRLVDLANAAPGVRRVIAHTLPEPNASTRVLQRIGMTFAGHVIDPDDGPVWRWELLLSGA